MKNLITFISAMILLCGIANAQTNDNIDEPDAVLKANMEQKEKEHVENERAISLKIESDNQIAIEAERAKLKMDHNDMEMQQQRKQEEEHDALEEDQQKKLEMIKPE